MQVVYRFRIQPGKQEEFIEWLGNNQQTFVDHPREGWTYLGTWFVVQNLGDYDAETRWELDDYSSFGSGFGDDEAQAALRTFLLEFVDPNTPMVGTPMKNLDEVLSLRGV